jgi:hypothetical protein
MIFCGVLYALIATFYFWVNHEVRPVWLDETLTYYQVTDRSFTELIRSFDFGINLLPYAYFLFPWVVGQAVELDPLALRLPSLLFGVAALLVIHRLLAKTFGNLVAFTAVFFTFFATSEFQGYLSEARPYSLYTLLAVLHLQSAYALFSTGGRRAWWANVITSALFPSVQFVGLVYSVAAAITLLVVGDNIKQAFQKALSFVLGWIIFMIIHGRLLWIIFSGNSIADPNQFAAPTLTKAAQELNQFFDFPAEISVCMIAIVAVAAIVRWKCPVESVERSNLEFRFPSIYLLGACVAWLLVPVALKLIAALGFVNLTIPRYLLPTLIATAIGIGTFLSIAIQLVQRQACLESARFWDKHGVLVARIALVAMVLLAMAENLGIQLRVVKAGRVSGNELYARGLHLQERAGLDVYTTDIHQVFPYIYHTRHKAVPPVGFLVSPEHLPTWRKFAPQIRYTTFEEVVAIDAPLMLGIKHSEKDPTDQKVIDRFVQKGLQVERISSNEHSDLYRLTRLRDN